MALITPLSTFPSKNDAGQATIAVGKVQLSVANSGTNTLDLLLLKKGDGGYFSVVGVLTAAPSPNGKATEFIADNYESADYSVVLPNGSATNLIVYLDGIATGVSLPSDASTATLQVAGNASLASIDSKAPALVSGRIPIDGSGVTQPVSGTVTANLGTVAGIALDATLTGGTQQSRITDGTNVASVKAASTAAVATDKALVVAVSPNNIVPVSSSTLASNAILTGGTQTTRVTDGTNTAAVKAASTAPVAADPAAVVSVSPNCLVKVVSANGSGVQRSTNSVSEIRGGSAWQTGITTNKTTTLNGSGVLQGLLVTKAGVGSTLTLQDNGSGLGVTWDTTVIGNLIPVPIYFTTTCTIITASSGTAANVLPIYNTIGA